MQAVRHFDSVGQEIYHARNVIRLIEIDGCRLAVKRYGRMPLKHRMATRVYKANKAKKAFVTSLLLKERSFESPEPVAFLSDRRGLLDATHYFVSVYSDYRHSMRDIPGFDGAFREEVTKHFARYAAQLHASGFIHKDFSAGNILSTASTSVSTFRSSTPTPSNGAKRSVWSAVAKTSPDWWDHLSSLRVWDATMPTSGRPIRKCASN